MTTNELKNIARGLLPISNDHANFLIRNTFNQVFNEDTTNREFGVNARSRYDFKSGQLVVNINNIKVYRQNTDDELRVVMPDGKNYPFPLVVLMMYRDWKNEHKSHGNSFKARKMKLVLKLMTVINNIVHMDVDTNDPKVYRKTRK